MYGATHYCIFYIVTGLIKVAREERTLLHGLVVVCKLLVMGLKLHYGGSQGLVKCERVLNVDLM